MSYSRKELQILGGSFTCNPPVDKIPITDYLLSQNFRPDQAGQLRSRFGWPQKFSFALGAPGSAHSVGLTGGIEGDWYVGANTSVYYNFNASAIATGFDGNRVGFVFENGFMWIMNQSKQGSHSAAAGFQTWNLAAPLSSLSAASASAPSVTSSATYTYALQSAGYQHNVVIGGVLYAHVEVTGDTAASIAAVLAQLSNADPNCSVTHAAAATTIVIAPRQTNVATAVTGSDSNTPATVGSGTITNLPNGVYQWYVTFTNSDRSIESNPGPGSASVTLTGQAASLTNIPVGTDARTTARNIYRSGGTLGQPYLVGTIADNTTTTFTDAMPDITATDNGTAMPITNDPPPPAYGMCGPYFSRLMAWNTKAHPNRLYWTNPELPQYWPGSAPTNPTGNWVDVGSDNEQIIWCTMHSNVLVIYKERTIWELVGDPDTGYLQRITDEIGLVSQFAIAAAGAVDYFVGPNGLYLFNMDQVQDITGALRPLFSNNLTNAGSLTPPGSILPGPNYLSYSLDSYSIAVGYGMGKLYLSYSEQGGPTSGCLLVHSEATGHWSYYRTGTTINPFQSFVFDGVVMAGLTGSTATNTALAYNLDDFRGWNTADVDGTGIECVYQSHYEDCGLPDNQKNWLEVVVDIELGGFTPDVATVYVGLDNGEGTFSLSPVGTLTVGGRGSFGFPLAIDSITSAVEIRDPASTTQLDALARNISVAIRVPALNLVIIHNVYLYYYVEARLATDASSLATDLGVGKVKQCKELELDIDGGLGTVTAKVYSDLPGNALAVRQTSVLTQLGRGMLRIPFAITEGYLWRLSFTSTANALPFRLPFRLYSARLLMRAMGVYVEAYESAAGFVWDSFEETFESLVTRIPRTFAIALAAVPIKRFREISLEIETFSGDVTLTFITDLPGNAQATRFTGTINTGTAGRRFFRLPLPAGNPTPWIEGRLCRLQLSGSSKYILYEAAVELLPIGVYIEAYEAAGGAIYDSREIDFGSPMVKECTELELDIETTGAVVVQLTCDVVAPLPLANVTSTGRQKVLIPLTVKVAIGQYAEGRLIRLVITGVNAFRLYDARLKVRPFGQYLQAAETGAGALWDSTVLDLGTQTVKQFRELQFEIWAYGPYTVTVYTDLPGNVMVARVVSNQSATSGRTNVEVPLPQGLVPDNYIFGRLLRVTITSQADFKLFGARIDTRPIGVYVESYEAAGGAVWDSTPLDFGSPQDKLFDQVRFEMDSDGACNLAVFTDLPGEVFTQKGASFPLTTAATSRHWQTVPLPSGPFNSPWSLEGRSLRLIVSGPAGFRIYKAQVRHAKVGRYLAAAVGDSLSTLEFDFQTERHKSLKQIAIDLRADGVVTLNVFSGQMDGAMTLVYTTTLTTTAGRKAIRLHVPPGIRGHLLRLSLTSPSAARIFKLRIWTVNLNEPGSKWEWKDYPLEESDVLPAWTDLPLAETPPQFTWAPLPCPPTPSEWQWGPFPVSPTPPGSLATDPSQWQWGKWLTVDETPSHFDYIDVPFTVQ